MYRPINYVLKFKRSILIIFILCQCTSLVYTQQQTFIEKSYAGDYGQSPVDTIVNIGYGTQNKRAITNSITTITSVEFNKGNISNPLQLIQGKVAGLDISKPGGDPNGSFYLRLRGLTTINCNTQPLIVVDGIPGVTLNNVDPNDIESFTVLKDAASASIYGIRGSNGVILVTTKKRTSDKPVINYSVYASVEKVARNLPAMNATEWRTLSHEMGLGTDFGYSTDWFGQIEQTAISQDHSLSLTGGSEQTSYRASFNYREGQGILINTGYTQIAGRLNITQKAIHNRLTLDLNMGATERQANYGFPEAFRYAAIFNPTAPVKSDDPQYKIYDGYFQQVLFDYYNPVAIIELDKNEGKKRYMDLSLKASYDLTEGLRLDATYAVGNNGNLGGIYYDKNDYWGGINRNGLASRQEDASSYSMFETTANFSNQIFSGLFLKATGGYAYQEYINEGFYAQGGDFITDDFTFNNLSAALDFKKGYGTLSSYKNSNKLAAFFGQLSLNFKNILSGNITARYEGSSRLGYDVRWNLFRGIGVGADLSKIFRIRPFELLKFRIDHGLSGNQPSESYLSLERWEPLLKIYYNGSYEPLYMQYSNSNPYLGAEKTRSTDAGIDFSLLNKRFSGSLDIYSSTSSNLLYQYYIPGPGYHYYSPPQWINIGKLRSSGFEITLNFNLIKKRDFSYVISLTHTRNLKNELVSLSGTFEGVNLKYGINYLGDMGSPGGSSPGLIRSEEGRPIGQLQSYVSLGIDENGNRIIADINKDGYIDSRDWTVVGNGLPKSLTGLENIIKYKNWDLTVFFRRVAGHDLLNSYRAFYEVPVFITSYNLPVTANDMRNPETGKLLTNWNLVTNIDYENASFISLDNICLGYNINLPGNSQFSKIRLYIAGNNLFYITHYKGSDPNPRYTDLEVNMGTYYNPLVPGIDRRNTWPRTRSVTFGANIVF
jgi:TonB-linked SusC/RagA family outer membrane protein